MSALTPLDALPLAAQIEQIKDPALRASAIESYQHIMCLPKAEHHQRSFAYYGVVGLLLFFAATTGILTLLASVKLITVEPQYLNQMLDNFHH